jgi:predicted DCC family thiol-disulfide oxidoreductase YuxK
VRRRDRSGRVLVVANQKPGVLQRYGITREEAERTAWLVSSEGRLQGAAALNRVLRELGAAWPWVASAYRLPPLGAAEEALYRWFAARRARFRRFGVIPECDEPAGGCT